MPGRTLAPPHAQPTERPRVHPAWLAGWTVALLAGLLPLWIVRDLPMVDLPQHLYVLDVMRRLHDPATLYPEFFEWHFRLTPYLGYYAVMHALHAFVSLEAANRLFLSVVVAAFPLSTAFVLRALGRQTWPALLVIPLAYGDGFGWGFVSTWAAIPLAWLTLGAFLRGIADAGQRMRWALSYGAGLLAGFFVHPVPSLFLALALPATIALARAPEDRPGSPWSAWLHSRLPLILATLPTLAMAALWLVLAAREPMPIRPGVPGYAWGPMFSSQNLQFDPLAVVVGEFPERLADAFWNDADRLGLVAVVAVGLLALPARLFERIPPARRPARERALPYALTAIAFGLYLFLPLNIQGAVQYLNLRFAPMAAMLAAALVPRTGRLSSRLLFTGALLAVAFAMTWVAIGFRVFDAEAAALRRMLPAVGERPRIMSLVYEPGSRIVTHPVYLHAAATLARAKGGVPSYTLMGWRQIPLRYRRAPLPAPISEWRPDLYDDATMGAAYDHWLLRGVTPDSAFGERIGRDLRVVAHDDAWWLVRRVP